MTANAEQRKLAAIMFTDVVGYSALFQKIARKTVKVDKFFAELKQYGSRL